MSTLTVSPVVLAKMKMRAKFPPATTNRIAARAQARPGRLGASQLQHCDVRVATMVTTMRPAAGANLAE